MKKILVLSAALFLLAACKQPGVSEAFLQNETLHMEIKGYTTFAYDPMYCQKAFNSERREFRVHSDNMSDFYVVRLEAIPVREGQTVNGSVSWTTGDNIHSKTSSFEAVRLEEGKIWLWSSSNRIAVVVETLE